MSSVSPLPPPSPVSKALLSANQEQRRAQLVQATIRIIAGHGLSHTTLAKVAQDAGLSPGIVNFYFTSKDQLLLAVLKTLSDEFMGKLEDAIASSGSDPGANLEALIEALLAPDLSDPDKVAVWYAFWGEARARDDYLKACGERDEAYQKAMLALCRQLDEAAPPGHRIEPEAITLALLGLLDQFWQEIMAHRAGFDRANARRLCQGFLASVFPWRFTLPAAQSAAVVELAPSLPAWTYGNPEFFQLERERLLRPAWHVVGHASDLPNPGDYLTYELLGERAVVLRGKDGLLRAFHNACRQGGHPVLSGEQGNAPGHIRCATHGWSYNLDGRLRGSPSGVAPLKDEPGLKPLELEQYLGFLFIRFSGSEASVAERFAPYAAELSHYRIPEMRPLWAPWSKEVELDWKRLLDNYLEGYHVPASHPGLYDLFGQHYEVEAQATGVGRALHWVRAESAKGWSQRAYQRLLPAVSHLPVERQRAWAYYALFPLTSFDLYPDSIDFFQIVPLEPGRTLLRARSYALPGTERHLTAARWLQARINTLVQREDEERARLASEGTPLPAEKEAMATAFHDWLRQRVPVARQMQTPQEGTVAALNAALAGLG